MTAIAIFVKTPGQSPLKTRLASAIGKRRATVLYLECAAAVAQAASSAAVGPVYWASAEPLEQAGGYWSDRPAIAQGQGCLGERMSRVHARLVKRHRSALLLGADCPQIAPAALRRAARWLAAARSRQVIGPASDGGFWIYGANRHIPCRYWRAVIYSRTDTLRMFQTAMRGHGQWLRLPMMTDLDTAADLAPVRAELLALDRPLPKQLNLLDRLASEALIPEPRTPCSPTNLSSA